MGAIARCTTGISFAMFSLGYASFALGQASNFAVRFYGTGTNQQDRIRIAIDDDAPGSDASAVCDVGAGSFTLDFWLRGDAADNDTANNGGDVESFDFSWIDGNIVIDRDIWGDSEADWGVSIAGGFVRFGTGPGDPPGANMHDTIEGNVNVLDGAWHHVAVVRDVATGTNRIYVDGSLDFAGSPSVSTDDISYPNDGTPNPVTQWGPYIVLGAEKHDAGPNYPSFNGYFDELRIWNLALNQSEIESVLNRVIDPSTAGLVAYYRLEEGSGTVVADSSLAGAPDGQLIAGTMGNGEWVSRKVDPMNVAPVCGQGIPGCDPPSVPASSYWGLLCLVLLILCVGSLRSAPTH